jgi:hypothetical protein
MVDDYWEHWRPEWLKSFVELDAACDDFLRERKEWSLVKYRWDNPDRLLSGVVWDGVWGNIHILLVPELSKFRLSYAAWRDKDQGVDAHGAYRVSRRSWLTSDDAGGDTYLNRDTPAKEFKLHLDKSWTVLLTLGEQLDQKGRKFREDVIMLPL